MKKPHPIFIMLPVLLFACQPQNKVSPVSHAAPALTGDVRRDVNALLPEGRVTVEVMDGVKRDIRLAKLQTQYQQGAREHYTWYVDYIKIHEVGQPIPFHENFGMSREEFQERQDRIDRVAFYSTGLQELDIHKEKGYIRFRATDKKLKPFENVAFNLRDNTAYVGDYVLQFADSVNIRHTRNGFKSKWKGYVWSFENPKDIHLDALRDWQGLNVVQYKIILGLLENGDVLLQLKATEVQDGTIMLDMDLPILI